VIGLRLQLSDYSGERERERVGIGDDEVPELSTIQQQLQNYKVSEKRSKVKLG